MAESIGLRINDPKFWDTADLRHEVDRIFDICDSCRLCFKFCGSFPHLFQLIDGKTAARRHEYLEAHPEIVQAAGERRAEAEARGPREHVEGAEVGETFGDELPELAVHARELSDREVDQIVDLCFQCKLCHPNCPYTPPHDYALDFPRLMLRWKAHRTRREGTPWSLRLLRSPRLIGTVGSWMPGLTRFAMRSALSRWAMERALGVDRRKEMPAVHGETFPRWWRRRAKQSNASRSESVVLFSTCLVDFNQPGVGRAAVEVLEHNGVNVIWPDAQRCCGMPRLDGGDLDAAREVARRNVALLAPYAARGLRIVIPSPSCSLMMREEVPQLLDTPESRAVAAACQDLCDFLFQRGREGKIDKQFARRLGRVAYHVPCHIRAQQIGFRGRDVLRWVADSIDIVQECSGHDGTWSMLRENFEDSLRWGRKASRDDAHRHGGRLLARLHGLRPCRPPSAPGRRCARPAPGGRARLRVRLRRRVSRGALPPTRRRHVPSGLGSSRSLILDRLSAPEGDGSVSMTERVREILSWYAGNNPGVLSNLARMLNHGKLGGTGKMVILPVDQGFEHGPARSFAPNPDGYDPRYHFQLAVDAGCNAYAAPLGFLEAGAADFAGEIPLILKLNN